MPQPSPLEPRPSQAWPHPRAGTPPAAASPLSRGHPCFLGARPVPYDSVCRPFSFRVLVFYAVMTCVHILISDNPQHLESRPRVEMSVCFSLVPPDSGLIASHLPFVGVKPLGKEIRAHEAEPKGMARVSRARERVAAAPLGRAPGAASMGRA